MQIGSSNAFPAVKAQYAASKGLGTRITFHDKYSTNKLGYTAWLVSNYDISKAEWYREIKHVYMPHNIKVLVEFHAR